MTVSFSQICRDYLALRGESPDLLPLLEEGEDGAVLTLSDFLRVSIHDAAIRATLATKPSMIDDIRTVTVTPLLDTGGTFILRMPEDYLRLYSLRMPDWKEAVREVERPGTLRYELGANAPGWMTCAEHPMVCEFRDSSGVYLRVYGSRSDSPPTELLYVPLPRFDGESLTLSSSLYPSFLETLPVY